MLRIAWLTTGRGPGSYGALEHAFRAIDGGLRVSIEVVFLNRERGESAATDRLLDMVETRGVPVATLSSVRFRKERGGKLSKPGEPLAAWRREFDVAVAERLGRHSFDLAVMFGYMLIATDALHDRFTILNDHPALPDGPVGTWQQVIHQLIASEATESGCMWNVVTGDLDRGPVLTFARFPIAGPDMADLWAEYRAISEEPGKDAVEATRLFAEIRRRGVLAERPLMVETLRALAEGRISAPPEGAPADLTLDVNRALSEPV
ncbi:MAG: formyltransferase family protein [Dehalococcoidia bacterium]